MYVTLNTIVIEKLRLVTYAYIGAPMFLSTPARIVNMEFLRVRSEVEHSTWKHCR